MRARYEPLPFSRPESAVAGRLGAGRPVACCVALALTVIALGACSSDDDDDSGSSSGGMDSSPIGDFAVVMNDGMSPGSVQFFSPDLATEASLRQTSANQGIAFGPDGTLYQNSDADGMVGLFAISDDSMATRIGSSPGKGLSYLTDLDLLASCDVTDEMADLKLFSPTSTDPNAAPVATVDLTAPCWDTFWSEEDGRLYAALTDGTLAIFDDVSDTDDMMADTAVDRTVTPVDAAGMQLSTNFHGVFVEGSSVLVSDVGSADSPSDGLLFTFEDDGTLDGNVETESIGGPATMLGNPVDVVLLGGAAIVAEKSNDALLVFENVADLSGDVMADYTGSFTKPESVEIAPEGSGGGGETDGTDGTTDGTDGTTDGADGTTDGTTTGGDDS